MVCRLANKTKVAILLYHKVSDQAAFEEQISYLRRHYEVLELNTLVSRLESKQPLPARGAVITFDDGFRALHRTAYPVLKKQGCPATVFLNAGLVSGERPSWPSWVRRCVFQCRAQRLELRIGDRVVSLPLGDAHCKRVACRALLKFFLHEWQADLWRNLDKLWNAAGRPEMAWDEDDLPLTWEQVREMDASGVVRFGNHTCSHRTLPWIDWATLEEEIDKADAALRERLAEPSCVFAFPGGEYDPRAVEILRRLKYRAALTATQRLVDHKCELMRLPRVGVTDDERLGTFKLRLSGVVPLAHRVAGLLH
jgi:peptidoglycan/xylan/chitin deacetylase (PgdA/CDA1 family)